MRDKGDNKEALKLQVLIKVIPFVKEGAKKTTSTSTSNLLQEAKNWEIKVDLGKKLIFPDVVHTNLRPDIVLWYQSPRRMILVELTVPWEGRTEEAYERKLSKYKDLAEDCTRQGWKTTVFPLEIGCRGFPAQSLWKMLGAVGIWDKARKTASQALSKATERASSWRWLRRNEKALQPLQTSSA